MKQTELDGHRVGTGLVSTLNLSSHKSEKVGAGKAVFIGDFLPENRTENGAPVVDVSKMTAAEWTFFHGVEGNNSLTAMLA